ncbi:MAG: exodeoxyribonuclease VII small subunit [Candidatus Nanopelagicales bacterium]
MSSSQASDPTEPAMGYEEARAALAEVVAALESGETTLEEALRLGEQGEEYARICEMWLAGAQARLDESTDAAE